MARSLGNADDRWLDAARTATGALGLNRLGLLVGEVRRIVGTVRHDEGINAAVADGAVVAGHSVGATILINVLADRPARPELSAIVLIAAPFVGPDGWPGDEFELPDDLGAKLPKRVPVHVFHGLQDKTAPPSHADLYARAIPQAQLHRLPGHDHQLDDDLTEVAKMIRPDDRGPVTRQ